MKSTLVPWLLQILDEDEAGVREALKTEEHGVTQFDLADIEAKRAIVEVLDWQRRQERVPPDPMVIRVLATAYAHRPGYRDEWWPADEWKPRP